MYDEFDSLIESAHALPVLPEFQGRSSHVAAVSQAIRSRSTSPLYERLREALATRLDSKELVEVRSSRAPSVAEPLVTIRIATYSARGLLRRAVESALSQDYPHIEVVIVGDACEDHTAEVAESYESNGVRFVNLGRRGSYPSTLPGMWYVAGSTPMNVGATLAAGSWIAPSDDDDVLTRHHVSSLLDTALRANAEMVWSRALMQQSNGTWMRTQGPPLRRGQVSHGAVMFRSDVAFIELNRRSHLLAEPADWNLWRRMRNAGVKIAYCDELTYLHFS